MRIGVLTGGGDLAPYVRELCRMWGVFCTELVDVGSQLGPVDMPVVIVPAGVRDDEALLDFAEHGGTVIACLPEGKLAAAAGITVTGEKAVPLQLRIADFSVPGLAGERLPIAGRAAEWQVEGGQVRAWLSVPRRYDGHSPGIVSAPVGAGRIVAVAFDLALSVLLCRQGDPAKAEVLPAGDTCARPSHLAVDIEPEEAAWIPFADMLARVLVELVQRCWPAPLPLLSHLPDGAAAMLLYSGDEDGAEVAWNDAQLDWLAAGGARMNLYLIPTGTHSTPADVARYAAAHDVGPHPNLRHLDGQPVAVRVAEFERQVLLFSEMFGRGARSVRNHCTAWAGYLELVEAMQRLGLRMDGNYFGCTYLRERNPAPYVNFGGALPLRFCRPTGELLDVFQQPTHLSDDVAFSPEAEYSYRWTPTAFQPICSRIFTDLIGRFSTPFAVCIHPSNWARFSAQQGQALAKKAHSRHVPVWSFDQWLEFWEARDGWRLDELAWDGRELRFLAQGWAADPLLRWTLPDRWEGKRLSHVEVAGRPVTCRAVARHGRTLLCPDHPVSDEPWRVVYAGSR